MKLTRLNSNVLVLTVLPLLIGVLSYFFQLLPNLDNRLLDWQFNFLREHYAQPVKNDVVVVGIDEASFKAFREPFALWHPHLGKFLQAMAVAKPAVLGLDIVLPERSYHFLIPQYDQSLLQGIRAFKTQSPLVLGQTLDENGQFRAIFPPYISMAGADSLASVMACLDRDGVARRFEESLCEQNTYVSTLAGKMSKHLNLQQAWSGIIDYSVGDTFHYIPLLKVLALYDQNNRAELNKLFAGKPVLLGAVLPFNDRVILPVALAAWEPLNHKVPGVLLHAQILRSMQNHGFVSETSPAIVALLASLTALFWLGRGSLLKLALFILFVLGLLAGSLLELWKSHYLPVSEIVLSAFCVLLARYLYDTWLQIRERRLLRMTFGNYVSPQIMQEIIAGKIKPGLGGERKRVCMLFSDIRGFSARSENMPAEEMINLLNGYFSEMTLAVHQHGGTVDKFMGDGMMAFFGAPQTLEHPEKNALEASQEMLERLQQFNLKLKSSNIEPIKIGIGLHLGEVIIGNMGSTFRNEYTAIGDVVNIASRLEGLSKTLGYPVICSASVAQAVDYAGGLVNLGVQEIKGHSPVEVYGWNPIV